jgi:uncharacterized phage-associated protein
MGTCTAACRCIKGAVLQGISVDSTDKFRELVLYIASKVDGDLRFGDVHLNKALFFSDAIALSDFGAPITTARYMKQPKGPVARNLLPARRAMEEAGDVKVQMVGKRRVTTALRPPNLSVFTKEQLALVDDVIDLLRKYTAGSVSDISHDAAPGWNLVEIGEDIPLATQMISTKPAPETVLERGRELASTYGW